MPADQIASATGASPNQVSAALCHLQKWAAVDAVEVNGKAWWFATGDDRRTVVVEMRAPEEPGTRKRRPYKRRKPAGE